MSRYEKIIYKKVFNFEDICELVGNINTAKSLIKAELDKNHIQKIKHNLYIVCDLEKQKPLGTPYEIGTKITFEKFIYKSWLYSTMAKLCISR